MAAIELKLFSLISGQEVIARLVHAIDPEYPDAFVVKQAMVIQLVPQADHVSYGIGMMPLSPINVEGDMRVYNRAVASECIDIPEDMSDAYIRRTSTIEIAPVSALIQRV
jgi:hypothetical protein